ncbi:MAG: PIN domain-containing protein [Pseudanabaena sp. CAN_BIN31]|nr:PIN domain-containing protein [Pseudanabaena sp. CAN_BIN31]
MASLPESIFLDTNIFIFAALDPDSDENKILSVLQKDRNPQQNIRVVFSQELIDQILRVGKRLQNKDWASDLLARLWEQLQVDFIFVDDKDIQAIADAGIIPREDAGVYLTAKQEKAECFVSRNYKLIRALVEQTEEFDSNMSKVWERRF